MLVEGLIASDWIRDVTSAKVGSDTKSALDVIATGKKGPFWKQNHYSSAHKEPF